MRLLTLPLGMSLLTALMACGARTGLKAPDEMDGGLDAPGEDAITLPDVFVDVPEDIPVDVPPDIPLDVPPDIWIPMCPDSVRVAGREASIPVDTIWALDTSFSMYDDLERMEANIQRFWDALSMANIDSRTIFVAQEGYAPPPPAGFSGRFLEVNERVGSWDALLRFLSAHEYYGDRLRPDAITHLIVVTDDDSRALPWEDFVGPMSELLGHGFTFHAVASEQLPPTPDNPFGVCTTEDGTGGAYRAGAEYYELAAETGGLALSICEEDWSQLFDLINERIAVRVPLPCAYSLPTPPPAGVVYDPDRFTVLANVPGEAGPRVVRPVDGEGACGGGGWWFFEGSDRVHLCPESCTEYEAVDARIEIDLGCDM